GEDGCRLVPLQISLTVFSAPAGMRLFACLIVAPQRGYDEPAILSYAISSFCPTSADGLHRRSLKSVASPYSVRNLLSIFGQRGKNKAQRCYLTSLTPEVHESPQYFFRPCDRVRLHSESSLSERGKHAMVICGGLE